MPKLKLNYVYIFKSDKNNLIDILGDIKIIISANTNKYRKLAIWVPEREDLRTMVNIDDLYQKPATKNIIYYMAMAYKESFEINYLVMDATREYGWSKCDSRGNYSLNSIKKIPEPLYDIRSGKMSVTEFLNRKNYLIFRYSGVFLVPPDQIEEVPKRWLDMRSDATACPYCRVHATRDMFSCHGCAMYKESNRCSNRGDNSYAKVLETLRPSIGLGIITDIEAPWYDELKALIDEYNIRNNLTIEKDNDDE